MAHRDVYEAVTSAGIPCRHMEWGDEKAPRLPWAVYYGDETPIRADDGIVAVRWAWTVELYEDRRDAELEEKVGAAIEAAFGPYTKRESWVASEKCLLVTYDFDELERHENG